jgi:MOSC domain-containing protein YiiM
MKDGFSAGIVTAVSYSVVHQFSKMVRDSIQLMTGLGVEGDAHLGVTVQHRSRVVKDPTQPNLRQVHLIHEELHEELRAAGFEVNPGGMGENITTRGLDLLKLPLGAQLHIGDAAIVEVSGLREPCNQLNAYRPGLMAAVLDRDEQGNRILKAGIMGIVLAGGEVRPGDPLRVELPMGSHQPLKRV